MGCVEEGGGREGEGRTGAELGRNRGVEGGG